MRLKYSISMLKFLMSGILVFFPAVSYGQISSISELSEMFENIKSDQITDKQRAKGCHTTGAESRLISFSAVPADLKLGSSRANVRDYFIDKNMEHLSVTHIDGRDWFANVHTYCDAKIIGERLLIRKSIATISSKTGGLIKAPMIKTWEYHAKNK